MGYMAFQRQVLEGRLEMAVKEYDASSASPATDGANFAEVKRAWAQDSYKKEDFNERISADDRKKIDLALMAQQSDVRAFEREDFAVPEIVGVYLESSVPS
jgi:hypothetical protein